MVKDIRPGWGQADDASPTPTWARDSSTARADAQQDLARVRDSL